jgi:hypothetical protein
MKIYHLATLDSELDFQHRLPSDPHEVVTRLQSRLNMMASAETISLCSDKVVTQCDQEP